MEEKNFVLGRPLSEIFEEMEKERDLNYPKLDFKMDGVSFKKSQTRRVCYDTKYKCFCFYIYPNIKNPTSSYDFRVANIKDFLDMLRQLNGKNWFNREFMSDVFDLYDNIVRK